ncbi:SpoIIE family protein phosphatase [Paracoccus sp. Z118]|uniref:PP2C family protein-serine/threonine phosphatase n=1 Tax=Paracoccus sp. Z118 TaxID=2851017 RepID=UPI001C2C6507|nr:SpoIIE family protein phosphatase [Paracoccus sp. Z118]MBV0892476.1 SpoIIE family protein phosphatase [Paracoccus sp. Z118]
MKQPNRATQIRAPAASEPRRSARRVVLLVDDSRSFNDLLAMQLRAAGYVVRQAESGERALAMCIEDRPDILLTDWEMPGMTGPDLCRAFRALPAPSYSYVVLLTGRRADGDAVRAFSAGADDFLTKPAPRGELLARLAVGERVLLMQERLMAANARLQATLDQLHAAQAEMEADLREARKIQQGLVRERQARIGGFDLSLLMRPSGHLGGDLVGFRPAGPGRFAAYAIDVSGSGITAALLTARLAAHLSGADAELPGTGMLPGPRQVVDGLNRLMLDEVRSDVYLTMIHADIEAATGRMRLVQAGHPHPMLQRADGHVVSVGTGGMPVGMFRDAEFEEIELQLSPGERLFIASDGVTEAVSPAGDQLGDDGLIAVMRTNAPLRGPIFLESLCWSLSEFSGGARLDDMSAVLLEYGPDEPPPP